MVAQKNKAMLLFIQSIIYYQIQFQFAKFDKIFMALEHAHTTCINHMQLSLFLAT